LAKPHQERRRRTVRSLPSHLEVLGNQKGLLTNVRLTAFPYAVCIQHIQTLAIPLTVCYMHTAYEPSQII
jgi:hypothetical protein